MGEWIDLEADIGYFEGNIGGIYLIDENGEYEPMEFVSKAKLDKLDTLASRLIDLEHEVSEFVDALPCEDCERRGDCSYWNRIFCDEASFYSVEKMRDIIESLDEMTEKR